MIVQYNTHIGAYDIFGEWKKSHHSLKQGGGGHLQA